MINVFVYVAVSLLVLYITLDLLWRRWTTKFHNIKGPSNIPWLGTIPYLEMDPNKLYLQLESFIMEKYCYFFVMWIGHIPLLCGGDKETAEVVLNSQDMIKKSSLYSFMHDWLGTGLLTSSGTKWKSRRRAITPSFHFSTLNDFADIFKEHSRILITKLNAVAKEGATIDVQKFIKLATLDIICETAMGVKVNAQETDSGYVESVNYVSNQLLNRIRSPWLWPTFIYSLTTGGRGYFEKLGVLKEFTVRVINERIKARKQVKAEERKKKKRAFLDMLLDLYDEGEIDIDGIREEVDTFMFEGHDTTSAAFSWTIHLLGNHPEVQEKLYEEIKIAKSTNKPIIDQIRNIELIDHVIKESLRMHPPVTFFGREIEKDTIINNHDIPAGTTVLVSPMALHRNPLYWDRPDDFLPERFAQDKFQKRHPYVFIPFSAGLRNCIGQKFAMLEMRIMLYYVVSNFKIESQQKHEKEDVLCTLDIIHKSDNGLNIKLFKR